MRIALWSYITIYTVFFSLLFVAERLFVPSEERDPHWETLLDILMAATGLLGMILDASQVDYSSLKRAWLLVALSLVIGHAIMFLMHLRKRKQLLAQDDESLSNTQAAVI